MSNHDESLSQEGSEALTDAQRALHELGRRVGAELRRPPPQGGAAMIAQRSRNRRLVRSTLALAGVVALVGVGVVIINESDDPHHLSPAEETLPEPTVAASTTVGPQTGDLPAGMYGGEDNELQAWPMYVEFREDGTGRLLLPTGSNKAVPTEVGFDYAVHDDRITLTRDADGLPGCDSNAAAVYEWSLAESLVLTAVDEPCPDAMEPFPPQWRRLDHPLVESSVADEPRVVQTALGTIEWTPTPDYIPPPALVFETTNGSVGLQQGPADSRIVRSLDGQEWTPIPSPPGRGAPARLAVREDVLYTVMQYGTPNPTFEAVYSSTDFGATWVEVPTEPDTSGILLNISALVAGESGVLFTTIDTFDGSVPGPVWVLGETGFDRVEAPFTGATGDVVVEAVAGGFFAYPRTSWQPTNDGWQAVPEVGASVSWVSPDGRIWTEVAEGLPYLTVSTIFGGTIYAVSSPPNAPVRHVVSTDGGRSWVTTAGRPPAPGSNLMAASDRGFVMGAWPPDWGPCIGVLWVSPDSGVWERAFDIWPPVCTYGVRWAGGDTIVLASNEAGSVAWIGRIT